MWIQCLYLVRQCHQLFGCSHFSWPRFIPPLMIRPKLKIMAVKTREIKCLIGPQSSFPICDSSSNWVTVTLGQINSGISYNITSLSLACRTNSFTVKSKSLSLYFTLKRKTGENITNFRDKSIRTVPTYWISKLLIRQNNLKVLGY